MARDVRLMTRSHNAVGRFDNNGPGDFSVTSELIHPSLGTQRPHADGTKLKADTAINDETPEIERDLCAFGPTLWECHSSYRITLIALAISTIPMSCMNADFFDARQSYFVIIT